MFVQVMQGKLRDTEGFHRLADRWLHDLAPGAIGWLGTTGGVTADGVAVVLATFESPDAARANSERAEQGAWFSEMEKCFAAEIEFAEGDDVDMILTGVPASAGFVQIMQGRVRDVAAARALDARAEEVLSRVHPALIGTLRLVTGDGEFTEAIYFTDEAGARAGEAAMAADAEAAAIQGELTALIDGAPRFFDLRDPILAVP